MSETDWYTRVEEILERGGVMIDHENDGWSFRFSEGFSPEQAIAGMLYDLTKQEW